MFQLWMKIYNKIVYGGNEMERTMCDDCIKKDVCKFSEKAEKFEKAKKNECGLEFIEVSYRCKYKCHNGMYRS